MLTRRWAIASLHSYIVYCLHTLVNYLQTIYNKIRVGDLAVAAVQVKRTIEVVQNFPGLGQLIKDARERDERSLTQICRAADISRSYWYQLEAEDLRAPATEEIIRKVEQVLGVDLGVRFDD